MNVAIMQPYFLPYIGYYQLINAVDEFILLDDVTFIKQGYINRNYILSQGRKLQINILVNSISSNKLINEHSVNDNPTWKKKIIKTIKQNYSKAPYFNETIPLFEDIILNNEKKLSDYLQYQIINICEYLNIGTKITRCSSIDYNKELIGESKLIDICQKKLANKYINAIGGIELYKNEVFKQNNIFIEFIKKNNITYNQFDNEFIDSLSIIDLIMFNSKDELEILLSKYDLIKK